MFHRGHQDRSIDLDRACRPVCNVQPDFNDRYEYGCRFPMYSMYDHTTYGHGSHSIGLWTTYMDEFEEDTELALWDAVQKEPEITNDEACEDDYRQISVRQRVRELQKKINNGEARQQPISIDDVPKQPEIAKDEACKADYRRISVRQRVRELQERKDNGEARQQPISIELETAKDESCEDDYRRIPVNQLTRELQKKLKNGEARLLPITKDDLQKLKIVKDEVCEAFYRWIPVRQRTIRELQEIIAKLDEVYRDVNIAKTTASVSGIVGTGLAIGGFVGSFFTFGATVPLMIAGAAVGGAGGVTAAGASIAEGVISRDKLKEVEEAIAKDKAETKSLEQSMKKLDRLIDNNIERIRRCNGTASNSKTDNAEIMKYFQQVAGLEKPTFGSLAKPAGKGMFNIGSLGYAGFKTAKVIKGGVAAVPTALRTMTTVGRVFHIGGAVAGLILLPVDAYSLIESVKVIKNKSSPKLAKEIRKVQDEMNCPQEWEIPDLVNSYILEKAEELVQ